MEIVNQTSTFLESDYKRSVTRLTHITGRLRRAKPDGDIQSKNHHELLTTILILEGDLAVRISPVSDLENASNFFTPNLSQQFTYSKKVPVYKWNIKRFSGKESLISFLELVESLRISRGCSEADPFSAADDLFTDDAWTWWYTNHTQKCVSDWENLVTKLKQTFLPSDYDLVLLDEVRARKQRISEPVTIFISTSEAQFHRLCNLPPEDEMVSTIRLNLLPDFVKTLILQEIYNFM